MAVVAGTSIEREGLVFHVDFGSTALVKSNELTKWTWNTGNAVNSNWDNNGTFDEQMRVTDTTPYGNLDTVWETRPDATSGADGGWNTDTFSIDHTKMYRFSVWIRRTVVGNGSYYLGLYGYDSGFTNEGVLTQSGGSSTTNPYFKNGSWPLAAGEWMLIVGHVWPSTTAAGGSRHPDTGCWKTDGSEVTTASDYIWKTTSRHALHRSYLYYCTDTATRQQFYQPRVDLCDGSEPTLNELLTRGPRLDSASNVPYDNYSGIFRDPVLWRSNNMRYSYPAYIDIPTPSADMNALKGSSAITVEAWVYYWSYAGGPDGAQSYSVITCWGSPWVWLLENPSQTLRFRLTAGGSDQNIADTGTHPLNTWMQVVGVYDGSTKYIYVNGVLKNSSAATGTLASPTSTPKIGTYTPTTYNIDGQIGTVKVYNRALSATEIHNNFNALRIGYGL